MEIFYRDTDITEIVTTRKCIVRDTAGGRCDSLELEFENAAGWYSWGPEEDDKIIVTHSGYSSGTMYVNSIIPENGRFRLIATSLPCAARAKGYKAYYKKTIEHIMRDCANTSGMDFRVFGIDGAEEIPYIERDNEGCAAFLNKLLTLESAVLKCINGRYTAIGISYAQDLPAAQTVELFANQASSRYKRAGAACRSLTVQTPYAKGAAEDTAVKNSHMSLTDCCLPVMNDIQAARWARGKLLSINRECESLEVRGDFSPGMSAMMRIDIDGDTDATGEWVVELAEHDLIAMKTAISLRRCVRTIR